MDYACLALVIIGAFMAFMSSKSKDNSSSAKTRKAVESSPKQD